MTVESTTTRAVFKGNGVTRKFPLPFPLLSASHLEVYVTEKGMADSVVVAPLASGYSVQDIATEEPYVVYPEDGEAPPLKAGWQLTVVRRLPLVQQTNLENGGNLHAETLETQFDMVVMQLQQLACDLARSVKVPPYSSSEGMGVAAVLQKMERICERAEYAARRVEQQADMVVLEDGTANLAATWLAGADILPGELLELPVHYVPGYNVLSFHVDGALCYPGNPGNAEPAWHNGSTGGIAGTPAGGVAGGYEHVPYQYEEVSGDEACSRHIRIFFPLPKGTVCHARVIVANMAPLSGALLARAEVAAQRLEELIDAAKTVSG